MDVFISWSGERSRAAAEALRGWLPKIINAIKPWLSSEDIDKGARWSTDVATRLEAAKAGIICLTQSNLHSDWILFEAGALSKTLKNTFVCPFLIGLEPSDVKPPLAQFQATKATRDDVLKLLKTLNAALGDSALTEIHIDDAFEVWWPKLEFLLNALPTDDSKTKTHRPDRELLEEILAVVRNQTRSSFQADSPLDQNDLSGLSGLSLQRRVRAQNIEKIMRDTFESTGDPISEFSSLLGLSRELYSVTTVSGKEYSFDLSVKTSYEEVARKTKSEIARRIMSPNAELELPHND
jgi:hypothetical protein